MTKKYRFELPATIFFFISAGVILLDQLTKILIRQNIPAGVSVIIIPKILFLSRTTNTGASFSLLTKYSFLLTIIAAAVIFAIILLCKKIPKEYKLSFALILGGTAGNLIDRVWFGAVTDFIDFRIWPVFNVADSAITLAAILLIVAVFREEKELQES